MKTRCPICGSEVKMARQGAGRRQTGSGFFPFCSERCKLIDLGAWLDGRYQIIEKNVDNEEKAGKD
jgi:hypothetical protein